jgi:hypothetical protein
VFLTGFGLVFSSWLLINALSSAGLLKDLWYLIPLSIIATVIPLLYAGRLARTRMQANLQSLWIEVDDDCIRKGRSSSLIMNLRRDEVTKIQESHKGLLVSSSTNSTSIFIPVEMGNDAYVELRSTLASWGEIETTTTQTSKAQRIVIVAAMIIALLTIFLSWSPWLTLLACLVITGLYLRAWWIQKRIGGRLRISPLQALLFPIAMTVMKFTQLQKEYEHLVKSFLGIK